MVVRASHASGGTTKNVYLLLRLYLLPLPHPVRSLRVRQPNGGQSLITPSPAGPHQTRRAGLLSGLHCEFDVNENA